MKNNQTYILPNGLSVHHLNKQETDFVYEEIFKEQIYFQHGISLKENATVFDIGANIGLFTLFIKQKYPSARVYAFEPSEEAFQCLQRNTSPYATTVMIYQCGISNDDKESVLTFYPSNSIMSGFYGNLEEEKSFLQDYIKEHLVQSRPDVKEPPPWYVNLLVEDLLKQKREESCQLRGISSIIAELGIEHIDLLKIDAEKCEMDIINGITDENWEKIDQVVMEAHEGEIVSVNQLCAMLESKGYQVKVEHNSAGISNLYAIRITGAANG